MSRSYPILLALALSSGGAAAAPAGGSAAAAPAVGGAPADPTLPRYLDRSQSVEARAEDLVSRMNLTEQIAQTWAPYGHHAGAAAFVNKYADGGAGQFTLGFSGESSAAALLAARNAAQAAFMNRTRLGVPVSFSNEALHSAVKGGTVFPEQVTQGASWDVGLVRDIAGAIALEARAVGVDTVFSPVINMWVDARFGRLQEGFSENPTLTAAYARAAAEGFQGVGTQPRGGGWGYLDGGTQVIALAKHYAAYGAAEGGLNGQPAELSERTLREVFLRPWRAFAAAGGRGVMTAHNTVLNKPCHAHPYLVNAVLREEFGFGDGIIISDCNDIEALEDFRVAANVTHAAAKALAGGVDWDLQCGSSAYTKLQQAVDEGLVGAATVRQAAKRALLAKFATGLFDAPITSDAALKAGVLNSEAHRQLALRAAESGIVLLKNDAPSSSGAHAAARPTSAADAAAAAEPLLPLLPRKLHRGVAVIGPNAGCTATDGGEPGDDSEYDAEAGDDQPPVGGSCDAATNMLGSYTQFDPHTVSVDTVATALRRVVRAQTANQTTVTFARGCEISTPDTSGIGAAVALARASDVAVLVLGDDQKSSGEWGDRDNLDLPGAQLALLTAVAATGTPVVLVLVTGRTATFGADNAVLANVSAVLSAFRPGQKGGDAIANLLTGVANPSGKLAQNWVRGAGQAHSGASPWQQWVVGKWSANKRGPADPDGRRYNFYNKDNMPAGQGSAHASGVASPLFYFGAGLSYSTFAFGQLSVAAAKPVAPDAATDPDAVAATVTVTVTNTGAVAGAEVVQVYAVDPVMDYVRPWKRLVAFARVQLAAGASQQVVVPVPAMELAFYDDSSASGAWRLVEGAYNISVGGDSYSAAFLSAQLVL